MLKNIVTTTYRSLLKNKALTLINIVGMGVGLAACWMIMLYAWDEWSYDKHFENGDRIFRVATSTEEGKWAGTPAPLAEALRNEFPEVENSARLLKFPQLEKMLLKFEREGDRDQFYETNGYYVDSTFFELFDYEFVYGDRQDALREPNTLVLSEGLSEKLFGDENPVGKTLTIGLPSGDFDYAIKGVFRDRGTKSHINANFFLSMQNTDIGNFVVGLDNWATNNLFYTYVKLSARADAGAFGEKLDVLFQTRGAADFQAFGVSKYLFLQPLQDIYLRSDMGYEIAPTGNITTLYIFLMVAGFILLIACINFMNLSTARSGSRGKEVGVRKALGAQRASLVRQFLSESLAVALIGLMLAFGLARLFMPYFESFTGSSLSLTDNLHLVPFILFLAVMAGLLAGIYPAFYLSSYKPVQVFKGKLPWNKAGVSLRKVLVVFQFAVAVCLILMVFVINGQLDYVQRKDVGFSKEQQLIVPLNSEASLGRYELLKKELLNSPGISSVTIGSTYPGIETLENLPFYPEGKTVEDAIHINFSYVGDDYVETLGFEMVDGRTFTEAFGGEHTTMILNESAVRRLGFNLDDAVGRKIFFDWRGQTNELEIVGVVKDFNFESLHKEITAFGLLRAVVGGSLIASVEAQGMATTLENVQAIWDNVNPGEPFVYSFLDEDFQRNYEKDQRTAKMIVFFASIAVFIACLGLYGLASFMAEQRTKEIGIRKTLGASEVTIVKLLSSDFGKTVLLSMVVAMPLAYYFAKSWLANFAFKIDLTWWYFAAAGLLTLFIALVTVSFQSIKAAFANPVDSLRAE